MLKVLVLSDGYLKEVEIENTLEALQKIVGGYIEIPYLGKVFNENEIDIIINEEGKFIEGLRPEIAVIDRETSKILDIVYGSCIFASHDEEGNTVSLNKEQIDIVNRVLEFYIELIDKNKNTILTKALFV